MWLWDRDWDYERVPREEWVWIGWPAIYRHTPEFERYSYVVLPQPEKNDGKEMD